MTDFYDGLEPGELILRDHLAIDRTQLANERTLLAYLRSGVGLVLAGVTFVHFAQDQWFRTVGFVCVPAGAAILVVGCIRFQSVRLKIRTARARLFPTRMPAKPKREAS